MTKQYKINLRVFETGRYFESIRIVDEPINEYLPKVHKQFPDATSVYMELLDEYDEPEVKSESSDSVIHLSLDGLD